MAATLKRANRKLMSGFALRSVRSLLGFGLGMVPRLVEMLADTQMRLCRENIVGVLESVGSGETAGTLIRFVDANKEEALDPGTYRATLAAILALGQLQTERARVPRSNI